ncbi:MULTISPECIES: thioredoxin [Selenomonas]|mgnify:FL=1|jgi:thioredoxin|uniref:Thioredoxin n=1 Tax=Selenomonas artemidis F0399 TaxID=749551 RepID=E7N051_9FIRM|nr:MULTISPECIES: thioredoxin [Selenomonas]EFR40505.1 thioredoxin [Selenomonas sp. oral taxon 137 str. F0430]EFW30715.1 thioredoxin [Selenomonas artemidis F0399]EJP33734.1 thioredoxin [Selenomonas sp. FOBRC9]MBF1682272.1 thioredoxin [Selenomonas artemidis]
MGIIELTEETFDAEVLQDKKFVIVDFWASWCTPCRMLAPILEEIADEYPNIKVCKLNVDDAPNIAERYGIMSLPALLFFDSGEIINESIGLVSRERVLSFLPK